MDQLLKSKYRIGEKLAENPFSITYRGFFIGTEKPVIIKIYKRGMLNSSLIRSMKQRVLSLSLIGHHGVAKLFDGDYGWQGFYYVREFINGRSVREMLERGEKFGLEKAGALAEQVLQALEAAHEKGIVHAALKPANIFIDDQGIVKLTDFVVEGEIKASLPQKSQEVMLDARYASPEELEGMPVSPRSDIFSLGLVLFETAAGKPVFPEGGLPANIQKLRGGPLLDKEEMARFPAYFRDIVLKATQRDPLLRFAGAGQFRESLEKRTLPRENPETAEILKIFESVVTQYGGEEIDSKSETLQDVGKVRLRWGKEKHRNWILGVIAASAVALGLLYAFFMGR